MEYVKDKEDVEFMYKVIANNIIMKFPFSINPDFDLEKDEVKLAFKMVMEQKRGGQTTKIVIPVALNSGKLKVNQTISSGQSTASIKGDTRG